MKKNLFLLSLLMALILLTYMLERYHTQKNEAKMNRLQVIEKDLKFDDMLSIEFPRVTLYREQGRFFIHDQQKRNFLAADTMLNDILQRLSYLQILRTIAPADRPKDKIFAEKVPYVKFNFKNGSIIYRFGLHLSYDEAFYLEIERPELKQKELMVVKDLPPRDGFYTNPAEENGEDENKTATYDDLLMTIQKPAESFRENRLWWEEMSVQKLKSVQIESKWHRPFKVFFDNLTTVPALIHGLHYDAQLFSDFVSLLYNLSFVDVNFAFDQQQVNTLVPLSKMLVKFRDGRDVILKLFKREDGHDGYWVTSSTFADRLFVINDQQAKIFFLNVEDIWPKQIFPAALNFGNQDEKFTMIFDSGEKIEVELPFTEKFLVKVPTSSYSPKIETFKVLFRLLIGTSDLKAYRLSSTNEQFDGELTKNKEGLTLLFKNGDTKLRLFTYGDELIVRNETIGFRVHFLVGDKRPFDFDLSSFFFKGQ